MFLLNMSKGRRLISTFFPIKAVVLALRVNLEYGISIGEIGGFQFEHGCIKLTIPPPSGGGKEKNQGTRTMGGDVVYRNALNVKKKS